MSGLAGFCRLVLEEARNRAAARWRLAAARRRSPTCRLHPGASMDAGSRLGKYNVLFGGAALIDSVLGDHTYVQKDSRLVAADVGKFCSIAGGVRVGLGRHPVSSASTHPAFFSRSQPLARTFSARDVFAPFKRTTVGHDVWIGENALIVDGVSIGTGAVIGAGAVVTRDVAPYAVVAGMPARTVRPRFDAATAEALLKSAWWDLDERILEELAPYFGDPAELLARLNAAGRAASA